MSRCAFRNFHASHDRQPGKNETWTEFQFNYIFTSSEATASKHKKVGENLSENSI